MRVAAEEKPQTIQLICPLSTNLNKRSKVTDSWNCRYQTQPLVSRKIYPHRLSVGTIKKSRNTWWFLSLSIQHQRTAIAAIASSIKTWCPIRSSLNCNVSISAITVTTSISQHNHQSQLSILEMRIIPPLSLIVATIKWLQRRPTQLR